TSLTGAPGGATLSDIQFWRQFSDSFQKIGTYGFYRAMTLLGGSEPANVVARVIEKDLFPTLEAHPLLGRVFEPSDFDDANPRVVLLSSKIWRQNFQANAGIAGHRVMLDNDSYVVIGVMPEDFQFPTAFTTVWVANRDGAIDPRTTSRGVVARLKTGVTAQAAQAELERMRPALARQYPEAKRNFRIEVNPLGDRDAVKYRGAFLILCGAAGMLVLIACLNVANLVIARSVSREGEFAIRSALGAARGRLVRQVMIESLVLAVIGGTVGVLLAWAGNRALAAALPATLGRTEIDYLVLAFTLVVTTGTAVLFGLGPAIVLSRFRLQTRSTARTRWRGALVVSEITLSLTLLIGAGLLIRSFIALAAVDPGFRRDHVLTAMIPEGVQASRDKAALTRRLTGILTNVQQLSGIESAGFATAIPMGTVNVSLNIELPEHPGQEIQAEFKSVSADYFPTMGIALKLGRMFTPLDDGAGSQVAIVNEAFARRYWPGLNPMGRRIGRDLTVVGVVADIHSHYLSAPAVPEFYEPYVQYIGPAIGAMLVVRTHGNPANIAAALRGAVHEASPDQPVADVQTMEGRVSDSLAEPRLYTGLLGTFAAVALMLTGVGIFGVISYAVGHRTREFGIRMALGARPADVLRTVMSGGMGLIAIGCMGGIAGAWALKHYIESLLFGVRSNDPAAFVAGPILLILIGAAACYLPARRATSIDPNAALRED
ncbi:MAG TPA: ABC transporter permease, partial [Bryobacteraceae bacterium]|nr:ABC transporter permease [Bryobacteraceae bacterium]